MTADRIGRRPVTLFEIDIERCSRTYGTGGCTAVLGTTGQAKCFSTYRTCQALPAWDPVPLTLRFGENVSGLPKVGTIFPALRGVSERPMEINLSGLDPATTALGKRARVTVQLQDFTYHDTLTDPYQAERISGAAHASGVGYALPRGSFFANLAARSYLDGRPARVLQGYVGDDPADMDTAHYVLSESSGLDAGGSLSLTASDIFDLVDNAKAQVPQLSAGRLSAAMSLTDNSVTLLPSGVGADYDAAGRVRIGREIMLYSRTGDVLTIIARGVDGTLAATHAEGDVVQACVRYERVRPSDVLNDLCTVRGPIEAGLFPLADANAEDDAWLGGLLLTRTISEPTGIKRLIGEICQLGIYVWWDEIARSIGYRVNRPLNVGESFYRVTDEASLLRGSLQVQWADDQRVSTILFHHGTIDPTASVDEPKNYAKHTAADDPSSRSAFEYGSARIREICSPWFGEAGDTAAASVIAERLVARYRDVPRRITGALDVKDLPGVGIASLLQVETYLVTQPDGLAAPQTMQVNFLQRGKDRLVFKAETFSVEGRFGYWMTDPQADYDTATDQEKEEGAFWMDETIGTFPDGTGPYIWF